jgi:hypothetical protein
MRKELEDITYKHAVNPNVFEHEGKTILNLWDMLYKLQEIHNVDFWDYYGSGQAFDKWADSKGYGATDPDGKRRGASNIWYKEWQTDIKNGVWKDIPYCSFIDMFNYDIEDLGNDESEEIYEVHLDWMMNRAVEEDNKQFGKADYRVHLTGILLAELGDTVLVDQSPETINQY